MSLTVKSCDICAKLSEARTLTDQELQIAVGKAAGFDVMTWTGVPGVYYRQGQHCDLILPAFHENLNAMHDLEVNLSKGDKANFAYWLVKVCGAHSLNDYISATARQRAEAYYIATR